MAAARSQPGAGLAMLAALVLMSVHVAGKAVRDTLFLSNFEVTSLPKMMIAASAASLLAAIGVSRLLSRVVPARAIPVAMVVSGLAFLGEWLWLRAAPQPGSVAVYLHLASISLVLFSGFWSVVNERFDPYTAKGVVARAGGFGALGGVLGGLVALGLAPRIGVETLLPGFAVLHLACGGVVFALGGPSRPDRPEEVEPNAPGGAGLGSVLGSPLLVKMAGLIILVQAAEQLIDYVFKATAAGAYADEASLVSFFAVFYTASNLLAFGLQTGLGPRALATIGLGGTLAILPAAVAFATAGAALFQRIWSVSLARAANAVFAVSFFKAGFELLWTPVPAETKRPAKVYVDVAAGGMGDLAGSGLVLLLVAWIADLPGTALLGLAAALSLVSLYLVAQLHQGYVSQLAENLRTGAVTLSDSDVHDATTAHTLADGRHTVDRAELLARIRELDQAGAAPSRAGGAASTGDAAPAVSTAEALERISDLLSGEPERVREALRASAGVLELVSLVVPMLGRHALADDALSFLCEVAPRAVGHLGDVLLDPETEVVIRRRVPRALEAAPGLRAMDSLVRGFEDEDFEVRLACARSAVRVVDVDRACRVPGQQVLSLVQRELEVSERKWEQQGRRRGQHVDEPALLETGDLARVDRSMELVFSLLALAYGVEVMASTLRALHSADPTLRGTALEYIQTMLPEKLRRRLVQRVPGGDTARVTQRRSEELAQALMQSSASLPRRGGGSSSS
jgi:AAA family ATP:ADP antiporter